MAYTLDADRVEKLLNELCEKLISNNLMPRSDKEEAVKQVKESLLKAFEDGIPQDLFTDPVKQKSLMLTLITAPLMEKHPDLKFDLTAFFKAELKPQEAKAVFKAFLTTLNKLEPNPKKRLTEEQIEKEANLDLKEVKLEQQNNKTESQALEEIFQMLFGITRNGDRVFISVNKGNVAGYVDSYSAVSLGGGSIHEGRGFSGDSTTDPYVNTMAKERALDMCGFSSEQIQAFMKDGTMHKTVVPAGPGR